jgi:heme/copper-type cytochrome/quinol oxidase subunit 2
LAGTAPAADLAVTYSAEDPGLTGVATFFTVVICLGMLGLFIFIFIRKRRKEERAKEGFPIDEIEAAEFEAPPKVPDVI